MKKYGHTGTLFLQHQNGKYKWSYKYEHCIECGTCNFKHKGRGLCTSCWDKSRSGNIRRKITREIASKKWNFKKRVLHWLITEKPKKKGIPKMKEEEKKTRREINRDYCKKNRKVINIKNRVWRRRRKGLPCLKMNIGKKTIFLSFESLEKPKTTTDPKYEIWKKNIKDFEILKSFYLKK